MEEIDRLKAFLVDNKIVNVNIINTKIDLVAADVAGDAASFNTVATPVASPVAGAVLIGSTVSLTCSTADSEIYYTIDGSTPDNTDILYTGPITISEAVTIKAKAYKGFQTASNVLSASYTITAVATPTATPGASGVPVGTEITLACATAGATIYYTLDGETPDDESTEYDAEDKPTIDEPLTLKAIAYKDTYAASEVLTAAYTNTVATPTADPAAGAVADGTEVTLSSTTDDSTIYYTTNGSTPDDQSTEYTAAIVLSLPKTIKAIAYAEDMTPSAVLTSAYTKLKVATPVIDVNGGPIEDNTEVTITCATEGATIYYTTNGDTPDAEDTEYTEAITIEDALTLKAIGILADCTNSDVAEETYTIAQVATPVADPVAGEVAENTVVELTCETEGATIYFTTDGSSPTAADAEYLYPITIYDAVTIKAIGIKENYADSEILSAAYTIAI